jgi:NtrC-family two-component system response regulator AlgB
MRVLVIDDEKNIRRAVALCLEGLGCEVGEAASGTLALEELRRSACDLAFLDLRLGSANGGPAEDGLALLPKLLALRPGLEIVIITAYATIETAVQAIKLGARDYLPKPFAPAQIREALERFKERSGRAKEASLQPLNLDTGEMSAPMRAALELIDRTAPYDAQVLLAGESGTGKTMLARRLHDKSARKDKPFAVVSCPTLSEELLASELFGHARGAFTGALRDKPGRVEQAEGGTLFLDEIGELPLQLQSKLLRFLQDKQFERIGDSHTRTADVRIVAATNRELRADVAAGRFREDLLFRLDVVTVTVPPLRDRKSEILPLAKQFLAQMATAAHRPVPALSPEAATALSNYAWPGNVRELRNAIERALILSSGDTVGVESLPERIAPNQAPRPVLGGDFSIDSVEREHVLSVLSRSSTLEEAAKVLGVDVSTLWRKRKRYEGS